MQIVFNPTGESSGWFDHSEFLAAASLVDNMQLSLQHEAGAWGDMAMIHASGAGIEFYDHIRRARPYVHVEQFIVTAGGNEIFPIHVPGIEAKVIQGAMAVRHT